MALSDHSYELYITQTCPYCRKVRLYMSKHGIELPLRDINADPSAREKLREVGGKTQVPCLFVDGVPMYESDDIIAYLGREADAAPTLEVTPEERAELENGAACPIR